MSTKLFVGGLPWAMDNQRLQEVFAEFGDVEDARVILDRDTGRSRGFGFVTFASSEAADKALELNNHEIDGRRIRVDRAQEKERRPRPRRGDRPSSGGRGGGAPAGSGGGGGGGSPGGSGPGPDPGPGPSEGGGGRGAAGGGRGAGGGRREFKDDWGEGGGDRERGRRGKKGRGRRRGGRGGRGGGDDLGPPAGYDDFDEWD